MADTEELLDRLGRAEALLAIFALEAAYGSAWDSADADTWANLFSEDGEFVLVGVDNESDTTFRGRSRLVGFCRDFTATTRGIHLLNLPSIALHAGGASARVHFSYRGVRTADGTARRFDVEGTYDVDYALTPSGWRMTRRVETAVHRARDLFYDYPRLGGAE